jgi:hypothetical protein
MKKLKGLLEVRDDAEVMEKKETHAMQCNGCVMPNNLRIKKRCRLRITKRRRKLSARYRQSSFRSSITGDIGMVSIGSVGT